MAQSYGATSIRNDDFSRARANAEDKARDFRSQIEETAESALDNASKAAQAVRSAPRARSPQQSSSCRTSRSLRWPAWPSSDWPSAPCGSSRPRASRRQAMSLIA